MLINLAEADQFEIIVKLLRIVSRGVLYWMLVVNLIGSWLAAKPQLGQLSSHPQFRDHWTLGSNQVWFRN